MATEEFRTAARAQAAALGRAEYDAVYVRHPIQDQTPEEIAARADAALDEIVGRLTAPEPARGGREVTVISRSRAFENRRSDMQKSTRWIATAAVAFTFLMTVGSVAQQQQRPSQPPVKKHTYDLDETYIRMPLRPRRTGLRADRRRAKLKQFVNEITGVSRKSRDDGEKFWGRIAGTKYDDMIEGWVEQKFKEFGLQNVNRQYFTLTPQFFPTDWSLTATGGGKSVTFATVRPAGRATTPAAGLDLDPVWVGLGTEADFAGRDVKGKLVFIHSVPTPAVISHSATWLGAAERAAKKGAAAILINLAILGTNYQVQLNGGVQGVPVLSIGYEDATALRTMIESGPVKMKALLVGETKSGLKDANVWGTLPGATDEEILIFAHHDAYFEGAIDNASGMAVMVGLAEYLSKIPQAQRRRALKFVTTSGHHAGSAGVATSGSNCLDSRRQSARGSRGRDWGGQNSPRIGRR